MHRADTQKLYNTRHWRAKRDYQLATEPTCRLCRDIGVLRAASVADHVIPHKGDPDLFWNGELQSLCTTCHNSHKQSQERTGSLRGCDLDGRPLDPSHPWNR